MGGDLEGDFFFEIEANWPVGLVHRVFVGKNQRSIPDLHQWKIKTAFEPRLSWRFGSDDFPDFMCR